MQQKNCGADAKNQASSPTKNDPNMVIKRLDLVNLPTHSIDYINKLVEAKVNKAKTTAKKAQ